MSYATLSINEGALTDSSTLDLNLTSCNVICAKTLEDQGDLNNIDNTLDSLMKNTQDDAKKFFKNKKLPKYNFKHQLKETKKQLTFQTNTVVYTNGVDRLEQDTDFFKVSLKKMSVPWIGTDRSRLDLGDNIMWDINCESTNLPVFCKMMIIHQGACLVNSPAILARDASVQVGQDFISIPLEHRKLNPETISSNQDTCPSSTNTRKRRLSWTLTDEYYSIPQYQYRGKCNGQSDIGVQVTSESFTEPKPPNTKFSAEHDNESIKKPKSYETKISATGDIIDYLKISNTSKTELMSCDSNYNKNLAKEKKYIFNTETWTRCRKVNDADFQTDTQLSFDSQPKCLEHICPKTGIKRTTILTPQHSNNIIEVEQFEEYTVTDRAVDTTDLNKYVKFENYTYIQLLSETAFFDKSIERKLQQHAGSFRSKKMTNIPTVIARNNSQLTQKKTVDVSTLTENYFKQDELSVNDDITDILRRYNINGYSEDVSARKEEGDTSITSLTENHSFFNNQLENAPKSTPTTSDVYKHYNNKNLTSITNSSKSLSPRVDLNDLFLDLDLCVSTPRPQKTDPNVNTLKSRNIPDTERSYYQSCQFMHNNAKYPLISKAIHRPSTNSSTPDSLFSPKMSKKNNFKSEAILSHRDYNYANFNRQNVKSKSFRSFGGAQKNMTVLPANSNAIESFQNSRPGNQKIESKSLAIDLNTFRGGEKKRENFSRKLVFIPAVLSSRSNSGRYKASGKLLTVNNLSEANMETPFDIDAEESTDYFQRGRYLRSSYDKSLLMYSHRSGINDITNSIGIDNLLQKFRSKLHGSNAVVESKELDSTNTQVQQDNFSSGNNTLII